MQDRCDIGWTAKTSINLVSSLPGLAPGKLLQKFIHQKSQTQLVLGQSFVLGRQPFPLRRQQNNFLENPVA